MVDSIVICIVIIRGLTDDAAAIAASGHLTDYHWWFDRIEISCSQPRMNRLDLPAGQLLRIIKEELHSSGERREA